MATWTIKTYHKKSCEQQEYYVQRDGDGRIKVIDGFRWCEYSIETNNDDFPDINFTEVPGGDGKCDSLDLNCLGGDNVESCDLVEMFDGGCWGDIEITGVSEEEEERLREFISEEGAYALEDDGTWYLEDTEVWVWGPLVITNDETGEERIIIADEDGNVVDFED